MQALIRAAVARTRRRELAPFARGQIRRGVGARPSPTNWEAQPSGGYRLRRPTLALWRKQERLAESHFITARRENRHNLRDGLAAPRAAATADIAPLDPARAGEEVVHADLADLAAVEAAMRGVDCVVHLGAIPGEDTWEKILPNNVVGTWNVFEAARRQGVRRVVYASSHHAVGFYRRDRDIDQTVPPRPDGVYGVSKVFGEAVGRRCDRTAVGRLLESARFAKPKDVLLYVGLSPRDAGNGPGASSARTTINS